jgi:hypothetical protein
MSIALKCVHSDCKNKQLCTTKSHSSEYRAWISIKQRCYNTKTPQYKDYGGRGIKVCQRWLDSYDNFINDVGYKPSDELSIDRIDNDGNYEPNNCRWATRLQQVRNRRPHKRRPYKQRDRIAVLKKRYISGETGVQRDHIGYIARAYYMRKQIYIGWYKTETDARVALRRWALETL